MWCLRTRTVVRFRARYFDQLAKTRQRSETLENVCKCHHATYRRLRFRRGTSPGRVRQYSLRRSGAVSKRLPCHASGSRFDPVSSVLPSCEAGAAPDLASELLSCWSCPWPWPWPKRCIASMPPTRRMISQLSRIHCMSYIAFLRVSSRSLGEFDW